MKCPSTLATVATLVLFQVCLGQFASAGLLHHDRLLAKEDFVCPSDGFYAVPGTCSGNYYSCVNGFPYEMSCPGSAIFDPALSACVPPADASCKSFQCPAQGGFYAIPETCGSSYYSCVNGVAYVMTCPGSSIFDPAVGVCVPKEVASCLDETTTTTVSTVSPTPTPTPTPTPVSTTTTTQSPGTFICPSEFGFFPTGIPCDDDFWRCSNGLSYLMSCPVTTIWYQDKTVCDYPYNVPGCV